MQPVRPESIQIAQSVLNIKKALPLTRMAFFNRSDVIPVRSAQTAVVIYVESGEGVVFHDDHRHCHIHAPFILGLQNMVLRADPLAQAPDIRFEPTTATALRIYDLETLEQAIRKHGLWRDVVMVIGHEMQILLEERKML